MKPRLVLLAILAIAIGWIGIELVPSLRPARPQARAKSDPRAASGDRDAARAGARTAPQGGMHGRVIDELGTPVDEVRVAVFVNARSTPTAAAALAATPSENGRVTTIETRTDHDGCFVVDPPRDEPLVLVVQHPHFEPRILAIDLVLPAAVPGHDLGDITITTGAGLLVEVHSHAGPAIADADVRLEHGLQRVDLPRPVAEIGTATARTDTDGIATFYGVTPGGVGNRTAGVGWLVGIRTPSPSVRSPSGRENSRTWPHRSVPLPGRSWRTRRRRPPSEWRPSASSVARPRIERRTWTCC